MPSAPCEEGRIALRKQGYQFVAPDATAAVKPCMWNKRTLRGGDMCYKHQFYGIESHRCVQMTPTLRCNQRCLFCWRSFEHETTDERFCTPEEIADALPALQKKALSGYKVSQYVTSERFAEALDPNMVAISLSGEPTLYPHLPEYIDLLNERGYTTFLVSNGTMPDMIRRCRPYQTYISVDAPDRETYLALCNPQEDYWDRIHESLSLLPARRSAVRTTLVKGKNDFDPEGYAAIYEASGATFIEVKGYMYLGYSRKRLSRSAMPEHEEVRRFAEAIAGHCSYRITDESPISRVVLMEREV
ncbi:MAG: 4-demethylwyosine synthase TYW1 [Methanofollis liminatans]|uniref:S-adenosyl-L-methionine-dependent tRNA 4-demethylwyosine synthase n=1 Tax=Methanofollis liminatans DSM 4140 TaxID=28892 RepID=J1AN89_9EURY|nr:4-demethylwyosine synthase TYW1 [Methanofollis liminatans]EJG06313.1 Wyosine base formation domain-containing protein [Methanofollis liminatans DSM 4140]MDD3111499.1 4-demethylwyosine synthase TYW1 [Methanofollis liminatans]